MVEWVLERRSGVGGALGDEGAGWTFVSFSLLDPISVLVFFCRSCSARSSCSADRVLEVL
jgi:hypothetical protein